MKEDYRTIKIRLVDLYELCNNCDVTFYDPVKAQPMERDHVFQMWWEYMRYKKRTKEELWRRFKEEGLLKDDETLRRKGPNLGRNSY